MFAANRSAHEALLVCYTLPEIFIVSSSFYYFRTNVLNIGGAHISLRGIHINSVSCCMPRSDIITVEAH